MVPYFYAEKIKYVFGRIDNKIFFEYHINIFSFEWYNVCHISKWLRKTDDIGFPYASAKMRSPYLLKRIVCVK